MMRSDPRSDPEVLNCAAGEQAGKLTLNEIGSLSTLHEPTLEIYRSVEWSARLIAKHHSRIEIPVKPLDCILAEHNVQPGFDLMVVDVEGFEEQVFNGIDLDRWKPRLLIVELCDVHPDFAKNLAQAASARRVRNKICSNGYGEIYQDTINTVFLRTR
jgi:FkbM family methyltransferase